MPLHEQERGCLSSTTLAVISERKVALLEALSKQDLLMFNQALEGIPAVSESAALRHVFSSQIGFEMILPSCVPNYREGAESGKEKKIYNLFFLNLSISKCTLSLERSLSELKVRFQRLSWSSAWPLLQCGSVLAAMGPGGHSHVHA